MRNILVTGGLGYIGSHICTELLNTKNFNVIIVDNLVNSKIQVLNKIKQISQSNNISFYKINIGDKTEMGNIFKDNDIYCVIHLAGSKAVKESIQNPLKYYNNNLLETLNLINVMSKHNCKKIVFSSSATVYGKQEYPVNESNLTGISLTSAYGRTKYMLEEIFKDISKSDPGWSIILLRYFNPVGAHPSGFLGEDSKNIPNNLFPYILKVAIGEYPKLEIFGNDYDTLDGTCIRDFIHINDLAKGHIASFVKLDDFGVHIYNLGSGKGTSVLELVKKFEIIAGINLRYSFTDRREGDLPIIFASVDKSYSDLGWKTEKTLDDICIDGWNYISNEIK